MKNNKICLVGFISILCFSFILHGTNIIINKQDDNNRNVVPPLTASNSVAYEWNRTWGGGKVDRGKGTTVDSSGNIYLAGFTESFDTGFRDMVLVKYDRNGMQQWNRTWGGNVHDWGYRVVVDSSDNIYLAGVTMSFGAGVQDTVLVKYDGNGGQQWNHTWGGIDDDWCSGIAVDSSDNIYLAGVTESFGAGGYDMVLVKYDSSGVLQWNRTWGGGVDDFGYGTAVDSSGNIYLVGGTMSFGAGAYDMVLVKYDGNGIQQWNRTWGGPNSDSGAGVAVDSSDNIYLVGGTMSFGAGAYDMVLVKYDGNGIQQWNRTWGGGDTDIGNGIAVDSSGNSYLVGYTWSFGAGLEDMVLVKYDGNGVQQWNRTWGGSNDDIGNGVAVDSSGNVYLAGTTWSFGAGLDDMVLVKYGLDIYKPVITIISPHQNETFGVTSPDFNISIIEPNLNTTWYTLDGGLINITFSGLTGTINQTEWDKKGNGPVSIKFYANDTIGYIGFAEVIVIKDVPVYLLYVDLIDQSFSTNEFNIIFSVNDENYQGIDYATVQVWWNGENVSDSVINLRNGLYLVSLEPITVAPGEDPILLNMIISADGFEDKYFETYIAVDPDTLVKDNGRPAEEFPLTTIIIAISSFAGGIGVAGVAMILLRKRKRASEVK